MCHEYKTNFRSKLREGNLNNNDSILMCDLCANVQSISLLMCKFQTINLKTVEVAMTRTPTMTCV